MTSQDSGSDAAPACGQEVCNSMQVCCVTTAPVSASCIDPGQFAALGCELPPSMQAPCTTPADCDAGQVCCLNEKVLSIACLTPVMCPGGSQSGTYFACGTDKDCPNQTKGSCQPVPGTGDAGTLLYCNPLVQ